MAAILGEGGTESEIHGVHREWQMVLKGGHDIIIIIIVLSVD